MNECIDDIENMTYIIPFLDLNVFNAPCPSDKNADVLYQNTNI